MFAKDERGGKMYPNCVRFDQLFYRNIEYYWSRLWLGFLLHCHWFFANTLFMRNNYCTLSENNFENYLIIIFNFRNTCSGHGRAYSGRCRCDRLYYGDYCQYQDECIKVNEDDVIEILKIETAAILLFLSKTKNDIN